MQFRGKFHPHLDSYPRHHINQNQRLAKKRHLLVAFMTQGAWELHRIFNASGYLPLLLGAHCGCSVMAVNTSIPILIVDDYNTMIRIIRNLLRQLGFENIDEANDGSMALAKMRTRQYGLVISD